MTTGQSEESKQTDFLLEAEWRQTLPEVFRPIAERHGKHPFLIAYAIGAVQETLQLLASISMKPNIQRAAQVCAINAGNLAKYAVEAHSLDALKVQEIQQDIERAAQLGAATLHGDGNKIILPS